ncbi:RNA polymerase-associated protein LEO1-like isoform X3 [Durio zibethinus]|uniref:RNA polymerase-associated protein LEO1-like isoform X3 n=1 Tax=Durio zibethinus TaxID=66656 RepID=A0A6P5YLP4_DURZI|nr:RNA polymerase-associated protein LEO1-like isoform X3 [Durio zibethinus]
MFAARNLQKHCLKTLSSLLQSNPHRYVVAFKDATPTLASSNVIQLGGCFEDDFASFPSFSNPFNGWCRMMSTSRGRSMRSKVERRMQKESGKTAREIRRAKKLKKKLMTDEERLIYNLKRALFKARFEQALEAQKLNIKKIEQELRRKGINPEDPVAMASIQRVASTFFNAIDEKAGSPYVFHDDNSPVAEPKTTLAHAEAPAESDQEELDRFIAEIEDAADREWAEGEEEEKEEIGRIRYWNRQEFGGSYGRSDNLRNNYSDNEVRGSRFWKDTRGNKKTADSEDEYEDNFEGRTELDPGNAGHLSEADSDDDDDDDDDGDGDDSDEVFEFKRSSMEKGKQDKTGRWNKTAGFRRNSAGRYRQPMAEEDSELESMLSDLDNAMQESDAEEDHDFTVSNPSQNFRSSSDEEDGFYSTKRNKKNRVQYYESDYSFEDHAELEMSNTAEGKLDRNARGSNSVGFKRNVDADNKKIAKEAEDVFSD